MRKKIYNIIAVAAVTAMAFSCTAADDFWKGFADGDFGGRGGEYTTDEVDGMPYAPGEGGSGEENGNGNANAGLLTAGEWNDLDNWQFWGKLMLNQGEGGGQPKDSLFVSGYEYYTYWDFYTDNRVAVKVTNGDAPAAGVKVALKVDGNVVWNAVTDNLGEANLWINLYKNEAIAEDAKLSISLDGVAQQEAPVVTKWSSEQTYYNTYSVTKSVTAKKADIAFIVDATGSMFDEIDFLKSDLIDIFGKVKNLQDGTTIRAAAVFYRDTEDEYVTKFKNFTSDISVVSDYIGKQSAAGGGDFPEAVHTALEVGLQSLSWDEGARSKIVFMLLDAPAHQDHPGVVESLHKSIEAYAKMGIKIIPVAASGIDKYTEFMLRFFSVSTSGTYVFLTNDSGIGGDHIQASVGEYEVEHLNDLIVRLINKYLE
ncbi:MAG: VWA domain-containing protein [Bacteroidales bacterium]|nr:VWA domain-containing protein [Bacteroidales bacterium]